MIGDQSVAAQVATVVPTNATRTHIPLVTADPSAAWVAEGAEIAASDPTLDDAIVTPAKIAGLTIITNEFAADTSPAAAGIVGDGLSRDIARKIDSAFFGSKGASPVQPAGLEHLVGVSAVDADADWANLDPFAAALANAERVGLAVDSFVANPADALILATLKESTTSQRPLLTSDPTQPSKRLIQGRAAVRLLGRDAGHRLGYPEGASDPGATWTWPWQWTAPRTSPATARRSAQPCAYCSRSRTRRRFRRSAWTDLQTSTPTPLGRGRGMRDRAAVDARPLIDAH